MKGMLGRHIDHILIFLYLAIAAMSVVLVPMIILQRNSVVL